MNRNVIGRVHAVSGAEVTVGLSPTNVAADSAKATVGKFLGILTSSSVIVGVEPAPHFSSAASPSSIRSSVSRRC